MPSQGTSSAPQSAAAQAFPFAQASKKELRTILTLGGTAISAGVQNNLYGPQPLSSSGGYLRRILLGAVFSGGAGSGVLQADGPWDTFQLVRFLQPNSTPIVELTGYNLFLTNCYGGYAGVQDPRNDPDYTTGSGNNPVFQPFIPIEIDPTSLGALSDLSGVAGYQLALVINPASTIWGTQPSTLPALTVTVDQEFWSTPAAQVMSPSTGQMIDQATAPPYPTTIQTWAQLLNQTINSGQRTQMTRTGAQLRTVIVVGRSSSTRSENAIPSPITWAWDDVNFWQVDLQTLRKIAREVNNGLVGRDTGVYVWPFNNGVSRLAGGVGPASYLPTVTNTKFELYGTTTGGSNTLDWLVNEVTSAPTDAASRVSYQTGLRYQPPAPAPIPVAG
jgi:hypothetical protein